MYPGLERLAKEVLFWTPLRRGIFGKYAYSFTPSQLIFLCQCLDRVRQIDGSIAEIGCAKGWTTIFLIKYMQEQNIRKEYFAIDTFAGFVEEDITFEVRNRNKERDYYRKFQFNKQKWFDQSMKDNRCTNVRSIEANVNSFDFSTIAPLSFVLLDVDLYRPMKRSLHELYNVMSPSGIIVADDCDETNHPWDGAAEAYNEFVEEMEMPTEIILGKLGMIRVPA